MKIQTGFLMATLGALGSVLIILMVMMNDVPVKVGIIFSVFLALFYLFCAWFFDDMERLRGCRQSLARDVLDWELRHEVIDIMFYTVIGVAGLSILSWLLTPAFPKIMTDGVHVVNVALGIADLLLLPLFALNLLLARMTDSKYLKGVRTFDMSRGEV